MAYRLICFCSRLPATGRRRERQREREGYRSFGLGRSVVAEETKGRDVLWAKQNIKRAEKKAKNRNNKPLNTTTE